MTELKNLEKKQVKIYLKNSFVYRGKLLSIGIRNIEIDDVKEGKIFLNIDSIRSIQEDDGWY